MWLITLAILVSTSYLAQAEKCVTPNNEQAECVSLYSCPILVKVMLDPSSREFVKKSTCGGTVTEPMVCCGTASNFTAQPENPKATTKKKIFNIKNIIASKGICGFQHSDDYFHDANDTVISEFPWIALIEYRLRSNDSIPPEGKYQCTGSIVNQKYILTGAQCLNDEKLKAVAVRLGEYHLKNETDCMESSHLLECADRPNDYQIEKIIFHPDFNDTTTANDIGLIRIKGRAKYTDYVRPICLHVLKKRKVQVGDTLITSGWGKQGEYTADYVEKKKKTYSKLLSSEECSRIFQDEEELLGERFMCGLLEEHSDNLCYGDAGGPVMLRRKNQWYQIALISAGVGCTREYPNLFTRVDKYLDWILETVKP